MAFGPVWKTLCGEDRAPVRRRDNDVGWNNDLYHYNRPADCSSSARPRGNFTAAEARGPDAEGDEGRSAQAYSAGKRARG